MGTMCFDIKVVTCGPNEALIISGVFHGNEPTMIVGGRALVFPMVQTIQKLPLSTMTLVVNSPTVYTSQGVPISVTGVAQVKINGQNEEMLRAAIEQFGDKTDDEIAFVAKETLEGHQRAIMGTMTVEEIYRDRKKFSDSVFKVASSDLVNMGIMVISYTIKEVSDDVGYLKAIGQARTAEVQRDARVGEAQAKMQSSIAEAKAEMERMESKLMNDTEIAHFKRDYDFKKAGYDVEVNTAKANADLAYTLQAALMQQQIKEQETQVKVIERMQEIKLETIAEANKQKAVLEAQAEAEAIQLKGEAKAFAIEAKAKAEAEQMAKKADAWNEYEKAALMDMMLKMLPKVAAEVAAPLSKAKKITMISDSTSELGASKLTQEVLDIMNKIPETVTKITGVDITQQMNAGRNGRRR